MGYLRQRQLEKVERYLKKRRQRVSEQECSVRNVSDSSSSPSILDSEAEVSFELIGHECHVIMVQLQ